MKKNMSDRIYCWDCVHDDHDYGFCLICSRKPPTTGNPKTCPYFEKRK